MSEAALAAIITGSFELLRNHLDKPEGWKPTTRDINALLERVAAATPAAEKLAAKKRLGMK